ncbi:Os09g0464400 [Oryza sativa Japonica Group]|uniref:ubiquitinyl hydrolase 1 n=1 Tax=Oryza sativa subsp. japonica TaxID=39947 RepID=A0A0P0XPE6_ORYSJ|nr:hypothetical protein EE612_048371 [Oryza sativa]BAT08510.1 Os09g0464400 [Oryza sativa Japonica Group]
MASAALSLAVAVVAVAVAAVVAVARGALRRAAARREEVRRLARLAAVEAEVAEREAYCYARGRGGVAGAPLWTVPEVASPREDEEEEEEEEAAAVELEMPAARQAEAAAAAAAVKGVCVVCRRPTTFRCKRCKGVKYCTFKCQISHWRQGHKDECHPPRVDARPDNITVVSSVKKGVGMYNSFEQSVKSSVEPAVEVNKSVAAVPELSEANLVSDGVDNERKKMRGQKASITAKVSEDVLDNNRIRSVDSSRLPTSGKACNIQDATVNENFSKTSAGSSSSRVERSTTSEPELNHSNKQASGTDNLKSSRGLPSVSTVGTISSIHGSEKEAAMPNNRSLVKNIPRQQAAAKVVRHYPSEMTLFPYEHFVKLYNFDKVELRPFGLVNLGNSCYANAVLQCLAFTRPLTAYLTEGLHSRNCNLILSQNCVTYHGSKKEWCFMCEFEKLILEGRRGKSHLSPTGILSHLRDIGSSFGPGREEDAHEFLRYAIDTMQSASMKEAKKNGVYGLPEETTLIKCTMCQGSSEQCERILDLTVEIDGDINTLEEALHRFTSTEILDGDNRYNCSRCKSYERAKKKLTISEAPNILTIALKRYQSGNFGKINKAVRFTEYLNLSNYMSTADDISPVYQLYAVVVHHDVMNAAFSGHYVCYVKDTQGKWHKMDDSQVKPVSLEKVLSKCAYMLFYARCSPRAPNSVRKMILAQDSSCTKKAKQMVDPGPPSLEGGSYLSRHQGGQSCRDHIVYDLTYTFGGSSYTVVESPSPSDSSSLFSNSDAGSTSTFSSDSTDSTRNSTSMEEYDYIFGSSDQMYPVSTVVIPEEHELSYSRQRSSLNPSTSSQYVDQAAEVEMLHQHQHQAGRGGWDEGDVMPFFYSNQGKHHDSSRSSNISSSNRKLTEQRRTIGEVDHGPGEGHGSVLLRRAARERIAQAIY